ncbi:MAG: hypothetical protein ACPG80_00345 [Rickettsiales bacterium]
MFRRFILPVAAIASLTLLSGCVTGSISKDSATGVQAPQAKTKSGFLGISQERDAIEVKGNTSKLAGKTNIVVPFYHINYLKKSEYKNKVSGTISATANVKTELQGVDDSIYKQLTDKAYQDLISKLKKAGYTVADHSGMEKFQSYKAKTAYPKGSDESVEHVASGTTYYASTFDNPGLKLHLAEKANVLTVDLTADFAIYNRNTKKFSLTEAKETVYTSQGANITGKLMAQVPDTQVSIALTKPVYSDKTFGTLEDTTTGAQEAKDTAMMFVKGALTGNISRNTTSTKVIKASSSSAYEKALLDALKKTNTELVNTLASYK